MRRLNKTIRTFIDLLFPVKCLGCGQEGKFICSQCLEKIPLKKQGIIKFDKSKPLTGLIVASYYNNPLLKQAVLKYKYNFIKDLAKPLSYLIIKKLSDHPLRKSIFKTCLLVSVPLHKKRLRWRGFNQSELLAQEISQEFNLPLANNFLVRRKNTCPQTGITCASDRKANIKEAFQPNSNFKNNFKNKNIILVDDVCTTGATLEECAKTLKPLEPKSIWGLVIAKG